MGKKFSSISKFRIIAWIMLLVAVGFLCYAFQHPEGGGTIFHGNNFSGTGFPSCCL